MSYARALFDFRGQEQDDLSFNIDDIILILSEDPSGWWEGQTEDGRRGEFPYNYVEKIQRQVADDLRATARQISAPYNRGVTGQAINSDSVMSVKVTPVPNDTKFVVDTATNRKQVQETKTLEDFRDLDSHIRHMFPSFDARLPPYWADKVYEDEGSSRRKAKVLTAYLTKLVGNANELTEYAVVSWLSPRVSFTVSPATKSKVHEAQRDAAKSNGGRNSYQAALINAVPLACAAYEWNATDPVELTLQQGCYIAVCSQETENPGWWEGETSDGAKGLFPQNHVKMLDQEQARQVVSGKRASPQPMNPYNQRDFFTSPTQTAVQITEKGSGGKGSSRKRRTEDNFAMPSLDAFDELLLEGFTMLQNNKVLIPKNGAQSPGKGDTVAVSYTAYVWDCQKQRIIEFASSDLPDETNYIGPMKFEIGRNETIKALERAVQNLEIGQESRIVVRPDMGYGEVGNPPSVPPNCHLVYDIKLERVEGTNLPGPPPMSMSPPMMSSPPGLDLPSMSSGPNPYKTQRSTQMGLPPGKLGTPMDIASAVAKQAVQMQGMGQGHRSNAPIQARARRQHQPTQYSRQPAQPSNGMPKAAPQTARPTQKYSLAQIKEIVYNKSYQKHGVDPAFVEDCLTDEGFTQAFNCTRAQFLLMPKWKQNKLKQDAEMY